MPEQEEIQPAPGQRLLWAWQKRFALVFVWGVALLLGSSALLPTRYTAGALDRELAGVTRMSLAFSHEEDSAIAKRGHWYADKVSWLMPKIREQGGDSVVDHMSDRMGTVSGVHPTHWWNDIMRVNVVQFAPALMMRLEVLIATSLAFIPLGMVAFYLGERRARNAKREGRRPGDHRLDWAISTSQVLIFLLWSLAFLPLMPPVAYWCMPAYALTWVTIWWARGASIEI